MPIVKSTSRAPRLLRRMSWLRQATILLPNSFSIPTSRTILRLQSMRSLSFRRNTASAAPRQLHCLA